MWTEGLIEHLVKILVQENAAGGEWKLPSQPFIGMEERFQKEPGAGRARQFKIEILDFRGIFQLNRQQRGWLRGEHTLLPIFAHRFS